MVEEYPLSVENAISFVSKKKTRKSVTWGTEGSKRSHAVFRCTLRMSCFSSVVVKVGGVCSFTDKKTIGNLV